MQNQRKKINLSASVTAIVPAAGSGRRFGIKRNKSLYTFMGKPLLIWSLQVLQGLKEINEIVPVVKQEDLTATYDLIKEYKITKAKKIIPGGQERQDSVYNALKSLDSDTHLVLIHDGARPLIESQLVKKMISELMLTQSGIDGIVTGVPIKDTVKEIEKVYSGDNIENIFVRKTLKRELLWAVQTPQIFFFDKIRAAYENSKKDNFYATDDSALLEKYGGRIRMIIGSYRNIKITTPEDIKIAEALL